VRIVETIVQNMKPGPVIKAMKSITGAMTGSSFNVSRSGGSQVVYSPVINLYGSATAKDKDDFVKMIKTHQSDLMRLINENNSRNDRLKY
jgi:histone acetyltransferase (RNA polymerase elongator complex component)